MANEPGDRRSCVDGDEALRDGLVGRRRALGIALGGAAWAVLGACGGAQGQGAGSTSAAGTGGTGAGGEAGTGGSGTGTGGLGGQGTGGAGGSAGTGGQGAGAGGQGTGGAGGGLCEALPPTCKETEDDPVGPYYRAGSPLTQKLANPKGTGRALHIEGRVTSADCTTPLADALVEIWQADADGDYDNENGDPGPTVWNLRGSAKTDACGRYAFETIFPGRYLNGGQYRPAHIHYRVSHATVPEFITQLYFEGDPYNAVDSMYKPSLEIALTEESSPTGPILHGVFDIVLA